MPDLTIDPDRILGDNPYDVRRTPPLLPEPNAAMPEKRFQAAVISVAQTHGWLYHHTYDSRRSVAGFPDLILVRDRLIAAELKTARGRVTPAQTDWLEALAAAGVETYVWRPDDWHSIHAILGRR